MRQDMLQHSSCRNVPFCVFAQIADDDAVDRGSDRVVNEFAVADVNADVIHFARGAYAKEYKVAFSQVTFRDIRARLALNAGAPGQLYALRGEYIFGERGAVERVRCWAVNAEFVADFAHLGLGERNDLVRFLR